MSRLSPKKLVTPQSLVIEKTALELAALYYEEGRSRGLTSKYKDARKFAKANVEKFIPKAVDTLLDTLREGNLSNDQKDLIYKAIMERVNDKELSESIPLFNVPVEYKPDT